MGIRGLQKFMKHECKGGIESVSLSEIAESYRCKTGKNPVIICEFGSCIFDGFLDPNEKLVGGGLKKLKKYIEKFINNFFELGINLKVIFDGFISPYKHEEWIEKQMGIFKYLEKLFSGNLQIEKYNTLIVYLVANLLFQTSDKCEYIRAVYKADKYIINYIKEFSCLGVLTNNSNFILTEGAEYCLSSKELDLDTMTTINYNRKNLAKRLDISTSQLPLFGSLFYCQMYESTSFYEKDKFIRISKLVKKLPSKEEILRGKMSDCRELLQMNEEGLSRFVKNLKFFCGYSELGVMKLNNTNWGNILSVAEKKHTKGVTPIIYEVLSQQRVYFPLACTNVLKPMPDSALLPLRKAVYGILFYEYPCTEISVTEHCFEYCEDIRKAKYTDRTVSFQRSEHPGLLEMWSPTPSENIQEAKRRIFCQALDKELNPNDVEDIPEELLFLFLTIFYLFWKSEIKLQESQVKVLLIHAVLVNSLTEEEIEKYTLTVDLDGIDLSCWFLKTVNHLNFLNFACGEPFSLHKTNLINFFDGKILHYVYNTEKNGKLTEENLKTWEVDVWKEFKFLENKLYGIGSKCGFN